MCILCVQPSWLHADVLFSPVAFVVVERVLPFIWAALVATDQRERDQTVTHSGYSTHLHGRTVFSVKRLERSCRWLEWRKSSSVLVVRNLAPAGCACRCRCVTSSMLAQLWQKHCVRQTTVACKHGSLERSEERSSQGETFSKHLAVAAKTLTLPLRQPPLHKHTLTQ